MPEGRPSCLILASKSERRQRLLEDMGVDFRVEVADVDEVCHRDDPHRTVAENAVLKARAVMDRNTRATVLAADTVLAFEDECIGKPHSLAEAREILFRLSGRTHAVLTGVFLAVPDMPPFRVTESSRVTFRVLSASDIEAYIATFNPLDKAGAYDIGTNGDAVVASLAGSRSNVMGLPMEPVRAWLHELGMI